MRDQKLLPEFQNYLLSRGLVPEKNIPFYALWASRFLSFGNRNENLSLDIRIEQFLKEMETKKKLADWQLRQAEEAVRMYTAQFLSGKSKTVSPSNPHDKKASAKDPAETLARMRELIRLKHYSYSTEHTYLDWAKRFFEYLSRHGRDVGGAEDVRDFLSHLAVHRRVSSSTQNQAFNALLFLFREVLKIDMQGLDTTIRAKRGRKLPVVLSVAEVQELFRHMSGTPLLAAQLLYGAGLGSWSLHGCGCRTLILTGA